MNAGASTSAVPSPIEGSGTAWVLLGSWALSPARPTPIHPRPERRGFSALLVTRGMRLSEIRKICPEAVILPSDYETYSLLSKRFFAIVRRYTPEVEEYSIDECFADLTGLRRPLRMPYL